VELDQPVEWAHLEVGEQGLSLVLGMGQSQVLDTGQSQELDMGQSQGLGMEHVLEYMKQQIFSAQRNASTNRIVFVKARP